MAHSSPRHASAPHRHANRFVRFGLVLAFCLCLPALAHAQAGAPAEDAARVAVLAFRDGLAEVTGRSLAPPARAEALGDVLAETVDLDRIAAVSVGAARFGGWNAEERAAVTAAFRRYMAAVVGERLTSVDFAALAVAGTRSGPGGTTVVDARIEGDAPFSFIVRRSGERWRIVDVIRSGISELALRRSEFAAAANEGAAVLARRLDARTETLLAGLPQAPGAPAAR